MTSKISERLTVRGYLLPTIVAMTILCVVWLGWYLERKAMLRSGLSNPFAGLWWFLAVIFSAGVVYGWVAVVKDFKLKILFFASGVCWLVLTVLGMTSDSQAGGFWFQLGLSVVAGTLGAIIFFVGGAITCVTTDLFTYGLGDDGQNGQW